MRYILGTIFSMRWNQPVTHCHYRIPVEHDEPLSEGIVEISEDDDDLVCDECRNKS